MSVFLVLMAVRALSAQSADQLNSHYQKQSFFLSGLWASDNLVFDSSGQLQGDAKRTSFTLSGITIAKVQIKGSELSLDGRRFGLLFKDSHVEHIELPNHIHIRVAAPSSGEYTDVLNRILLRQADQLLPTLPREWQTAARHYFPGDGTTNKGSPVVESAVQPSTDPPVYKILGAIKPPVLLHIEDAQFSEAARKLKISGKVTVRCHVDENGTTSHFEIVQPAGLGLDEQALVAVSKYRLSPARYNNQPVAVELNTVVAFTSF